VRCTRLVVARCHAECSVIVAQGLHRVLFGLCARPQPQGKWRGCPRLEEEPFSSPFCSALFTFCSALFAFCSGLFAFSSALFTFSGAPRLLLQLLPPQPRPRAAPAALRAAARMACLL